ncbi:MAG: hypothetical protein UY76_C0008G0029 [Candidatus Uhrbacteria bacterium GW2011_GWA2_52_8d]|uniref:Aminoglycoside phosphotransferase domain-containing protein n=1 Tax=Candidatus Uhrbacteria bacterium GW2011_GWA2_52_8d TaxID=1618979 RepID=A0A0G1XQG8_9BACT|nr:MAG: hypothetical protein UY76_C0008G0029 [Candidatus Uhrbacteria bacterium GW2011_GWA2_52_8d]
MSQNFRVETDKGTYFLKQYRNRINTNIYEIKEAEAFFASGGIQIISPIKDRYEREAFWDGEHWFSLFPFIFSQSPIATKMNLTLVGNLARTLSRIHLVGQSFPKLPFQLLRIGTERKFHLEQVELLRILQGHKQKTALEERMMDILRKKAVYKRDVIIQPQDLLLSYDRLLHGDYQYTNVFIDQTDEVTHVYDLERACLGPTEYEVVRSLMLNCFDDGWKPRNFSHARHYLNEYRSNHPLSFDLFRQAMHLYAYNILHMTWIEARYLVFGIDTQLDLFNRHADRVEFFATQNIDSFCEETFPM